MKISIFLVKWVIERTESGHLVTSDCTETCFGNDDHFLTRPDQKCSSGDRTGCPYRSSLRKVFPTVVSKTVPNSNSLFMCDWWAS